MKQTIFKFLTALVAILPFVACNRDPHFITDRQYRNQVHDDFLQRQQLAQGRAEALFGGMDTLSNREREALEFLYAYMPYSDLADYDGKFYLEQVRTAFAARDTFSWGKDIPEDIFRHFVLVYRVNNENLDTARQYMFHQLKERVKDLPMDEAALEVNHWCHEHVAYRAADARTSAPLATLRTSLGRCGEESTFAVTALRSVGIPARQCYTPRWAHCDDNHAWVEVWVNGEWKFLGACEPDPKLDMGWFAVPSTRCLMVHSKAFGRYHGDEEVVKETSLYSELNLLSHYAPTKHVTVTVLSQDNQPVRDACVKFKMYNYAEYYTLANYTTDANGQASLTTGLGDLLIWATDGEHYNYAKLDVRKQDQLTIYLSRDGTAEYIENLEIVPPVAGKVRVTPTEEAVAANAKRIAYEDSLRAAYTATFPTRENYKSYLPKNWSCDAGFLSDDQLWEIIQKSEGNHAEICKFFGYWLERGKSPKYIYDYIKSYSDKDLRDITAEVLELHITDFSPTDTVYGLGQPYTYDVYKKGILPARISNELVRPYRGELASFKGMTSEAICQWTIDSVAVDDTGNYYNCPISPRGVYQLRHADVHSRDIFFVAACRTAGIPTYLDNATNTIYQWGNGRWNTVSLDASRKAASNTAKLTLTYNGKEPQKPIYYPHFTIQKFEDGDFVTYDFEGDPRMEYFPATIELEAGYYCLSTGNRYPEGDVLSRMEFFTIDSGQHVIKEIVIRPLIERGQGNGIKISNQLTITEGVTVEDYAGGTGMIFAFMGSHREPAKHLVKEMLEHRQEFKRWNGMTYITTTEPGNRDLQQLANVDIAPMQVGDKSPLEAAVAEALQLDKYEYPLVAIVDCSGNILFHSTGYRIGLAELLLKYCK